MHDKAGRRGSVAVETALTLTLLFTVGFLAGDMHRIGIERSRLEATASSVALNITAQSGLTQAGLDSLTDIAMQGHTDEQQIIMLNVLQSGRINWQLERGGASDLCEAEAEDGYYTGDLPIDPSDMKEAASSEEDSSEFSLIVVKACRSTESIKSYGGIGMPQVLQVRSIYRANAQEISLDDALEEENQITDDSE